MISQLVDISDRVHRWRFLTNERRAELILLLDDLLAEIEQSRIKSDPQPRLSEIEIKDGFGI